jgi:hypothetical protein
MVDVKEIKKLLAKHFKIKHNAKIDPQTGVVDVDGDAELRTKVKHLPVKFGTVGGSFFCNHNQLTTLEGAPHSVGYNFYCNHNQLTNLKGAPSSVDRNFWCGINPLTTLEGAPQEVGGDFFVTYSKNLPLLRLLQYKKVNIVDAPERVQDIMIKYAGTGKKGMLAAGVELTKAGFKNNARW